ncbi:MAG: trypsin-like peptidase domain-containing protein [Nitrososphaeria archaeon]|jgi:S1-C subfamily serine protease
MSANSRTIFVIVIVIAILIAGSIISLGLLFGRKTTTVTKTITYSNPTQTYAATTTTTTTIAALTETITQTNASNAVNASQIFAEADPSVVTVIAYDSQLNPLDLGSGFLYDNQGDFITNDHVVSNGTYFVIQTYDDQWINATLKGTDAYADLAVLQANVPVSLPPLKFASSVTVGEPAFAIGSPYGFEGSITAGIVSQVNRTGIEIIPMLQTDAALNPGNSGGPLLNSAGEVLGINTAGINASQSVGFAIPYNLVEMEVPTLIKTGTYSHPLIGIYGSYLDPISAKSYNLPSNLTYGFYIISIVPGSSASRSSLRAGDVIIKIDNYVIRKDPDINYLMTYVYSPNQSVTITVIRNGNQVQVQLTLGVYNL